MFTHPQHQSRELKQLIQKNAQGLTDQEIDYLTKFEFSQSNFYGLPKIHKSKTIQDEVRKQKSDYILTRQPDDLKFRPIVAGCNCPTHRLSEFMDRILKPLTHHIKSYIRDSIDFLNKLPEKISENSYFVTFDVSSLYTSIPHLLGLQAIEYWLDKQQETLNNRFSKIFLLQAIEFILCNNTFHFDGDTYLQICGTATGTRVAPTYATLTMAFLEETKLYPKIQNALGERAEKYTRENWFRFLDDCFIIWDIQLGTIEQLTDILNNMDPSINFTVEYNKKEIPFLDISVYSENGKIQTDMYHKETDTFSYLDFTSSHPHHCKENIPFNLARRICSIVSDTERRENRLNQLHKRLLRRNYPENLILACIQKAKAIPKESLRAQPDKSKSTNNNIAFITTYNPSHPDTFKYITSLKEGLRGSTKMRRIVDDQKWIKAHRQPPNLKDILCHSAFRQQKDQETSPKVRKCKNPRCGMCPHIEETSQISLNSNETEKFKIKEVMDCDSRNLIYCIVCRGCGEKYIGQTGDVIRNRVHKQQILHEDKRMLGMSEHISKCSQNYSPNFKIIPFFKIKSDNEDFRKNMESYFIKRFKPKLNKLTLSSITSQ